jgi:hypothetical protein
MRLLICSFDQSCAEWVRNTLLDFGRGMRITISISSETSILQENWSYIIFLGNIHRDVVVDMPYSRFVIYDSLEDQVLLYRSLWVLYRDTLYDMIGTKCCCGLYDVCHCH